MSVSLDPSVMIFPRVLLGSQLLGRCQKRRDFGRERGERNNVDNGKNQSYETERIEVFCAPLPLSVGHDEVAVKVQAASLGPFISAWASLARPASRLFNPRRQV